MARRRMFSLELVSSDKFLCLPNSAQAFYFHLNLHADDEGFVAAPRSLGMLCGGTADDLDSLEKAGFLIRFDSGVVLITHWHLNNTIRKDRSMDTIHRAEKAMIRLVDDVYILAQNTDAAPLATKMATNMTTNLSAISAPQNRIEENRIDNNIIDKNISDQNIAPDAGESADNWDGTGMETPMTNTYPTCSEIDIYCDEQGLRNVSAAQFWAHYYLNGWKDKDGQPVKDWKALLKRWNDSG